MNPPWPTGCIALGRAEAIETPSKGSWWTHTGGGGCIALGRAEAIETTAVRVGAR